MMLNRMPDHPSDSSPSRDWSKYKVKFCNVPRLCIGFKLKGSSDSEGAKSPTSPLDIKTFSGVGITHSGLGSPKQQRVTIPIGSPHGFANPTSQTGMEHSESYTCVTSHGSKLSTKHIYNHCGTKCETVQCSVRKQHEHGVWDVATAAWSNSNVAVFPVAHFLRTCYLCKRQLNHGKDIYMYRGDKAFCSVECRYKQILMDKRMETFTASQPYSRSDTSYAEELGDGVRLFEEYGFGMSFVGVEFVLFRKLTRKVEILRLRIFSEFCSS